jgi:hypothetical protein
VEMETSLRGTELLEMLKRKSWICSLRSWYSQKIDSLHSLKLTRAFFIPELFSIYHFPRARISNPEFWFHRSASITPQVTHLDGSLPLKLQFHKISGEDQISHTSRWYKNSTDLLWKHILRNCSTPKIASIKTCATLFISPDYKCKYQERLHAAVINSVQLLFLLAREKN